MLGNGRNEAMGRGKTGERWYERVRINHDQGTNRKQPYKTSKTLKIYKEIQPCYNYDSKKHPLLSPHKCTKHLNQLFFGSAKVVC